MSGPLADATLGQVHVPVESIERAVDFYRDTLGLPFLFDVPGRPMAFFDCGGVRLYLDRPSDDEPPMRPILYFRVDSVEEAHRALADRGVAFQSKPHVVHRTDTSELRMAFFQDSEGNTLALMAETAV